MLERLFMLSWYGKLQWTWIFWPVMKLFQYVVNQKRRQFLAAKSLASKPLPSKLPVIVIGNITVGGTGKTPVVMALVSYLQAKGYRPGIISRGYGGTLTQYPHLIKSTDDCSVVGDEPYMLSRALQVPVVVDPKRRCALDYISTLNVDIILSDDGLQHYELPRDMELCVLDGLRGLGNGQLIPVGPLREPATRLNSVDMTLYSGLKSTRNESDECFEFVPVAWVNVKSNEIKCLEEFEITKDVSAIAGIGNPQKFIKTLKSLKIECQLKVFSDHYSYTKEDVNLMASQTLMTEKDAVKIKPFAHDNMWYLRIEAGLSSSFFQRFDKKLQAIMEQKNG